MASKQSAAAQAKAPKSVKTATKAAPKPAAKATVKPAVKPVVKPTARAEKAAAPVKTAARSAVNAAARTPVKAASKTAAKPVVKSAPKPPAKAAARHRAAAAPASLAQAAARKLATPPRSRPGTAAVATAPPRSEAARPQLVRDSFTMPEPEYAVLGAVKQACLKAGFEVKKSELLRIGVALLGQLDMAALRAVLSSLPQLKTGRPPAE